ncbi:MAG: translation initiation factor IF-3 [Candidatus Paceibacterota bacterium]|nr:translation initiation factor IF-3 [Candidatus Paceibacterota bacterium]MDD4830634.1 translation initiation factor IF-3 [Candidatus Paceibacterota bacterium]MDD4875176.1 translation initiation factor IF-3 [Candidatus Paceibacterota bacterium]
MNNQIRASEVRLIDEEGKQIGVLPLSQALKAAREKSLDLIQITEKVEPPICKIGNYGKYLYSVQKKEKKDKSVGKTGEIKGIRLGFNIGIHDLETRARKAEECLKDGSKIKVELILRGRERGLKNFAEQKIQQFLDILSSKMPIKTERELKKEARSLTIIISKK